VGAWPTDVVEAATVSDCPFPSVDPSNINPVTWAIVFPSLIANMSYPDPEFGRVLAGTVYEPAYAATSVARVLSMETAFVSELVIFRSMREGSVKSSDHDITRARVGSIFDPGVGEVNFRAEA